MFEWDITHNDLMTRLASYDLKLENGLVQPPQAPDWASRSTGISSPRMPGRANPPSAPDTG